MPWPVRFYETFTEKGGTSYRDSTLPITVLLLATAIQLGYIQLAAFLWVGPLVTGGLLGALPLLFALGRWLFSLRKAHPHGHSLEDVPHRSRSRSDDHA